MLSSSRARSALAIIAVALLALLLRWPGAGAPRAGACAIATQPRVYEPRDYRGQYPFLMQLAAYDQLFPGDAEFGRQPLEQGPRAARVPNGGGHIPPALLDSIAYIESAWQMASSTVPYGGSGPGLVASDCGYGIMQVTSGMTVPQGPDGAPSAVQSLTGTHYAYNIARGTAILANKWNDGGDIRPIVGDGNPLNLESWYYAVWGYNGFVLQNHPFSERFQNAVRVPYSCNAGDALGHDRSQYPYQELVFGCAQRPPVRDGAPLWQPQVVALPNLVDPAVKAALDTANFRFPYGGMDLPQPPVVTPDRSTPPATAGLAAILARPAIEVDAPVIRATVEKGDPLPRLPAITLSTNGPGIATWMVRSSKPWLSTNTMAGVVLGPAVPCVSEIVFCDRTFDVRPIVNLGALAPGRNDAVLTFLDPRAPAQTHRVTVSITLTEPGQTELRVRALADGCNAVGVAFADGTPVESVVAAIEPADGLSAMWRLPQPGSAFELYLPGQSEVSTLAHVNAHEGLFICTDGAAAFGQTVELAGPPLATPLAPGCSFVAVSQDGSAASFVALMEPAGAVEAVWRLDTPSGTWQVHLPAAEGASTLPQVTRLDGVFVCTDETATLTQPGLAPSPQPRGSAPTAPPPADATPTPDATPSEPTPTPTPPG